MVIVGEREMQLSLHQMVHWCTCGHLFTGFHREWTLIKNKAWVIVRAKMMTVQLVADAALCTMVQQNTNSKPTFFRF